MSKTIEQSFNKLESAVDKNLARIKQLEKVNASLVESLEELILIIGLTPIKYEYDLEVLEEAVNDAKETIKKAKGEA